ncbi:MAG: hypothetical protein ABI790_10995 [Betaproteobacteria bacterium]
MSTGGQVDAVPEPGELPSGEGTSATRIEIRTPQEICADYGSDFVPPAPLEKVAVALATLDQPPLNARRVTPERGACGWYIWGGEGGGRSGTPGFFQTLQVAHLLERCPQIIPFLGLAPGWRVRLAAEGPEIKPPHAVAPPDNVAVRRIGSRITRPPAVKQWVWLSILLHILAIVLFGDTTGQGTVRGDRPGGPLNVTLQGKADHAADALVLRADTRLISLPRRETAAAAVPPSPAATTADSAPPKTADDAPAAPVMPRVIATDVEKPVTTFVVPVSPPEVVAPAEPPAARLPESLPRLDAIVPPKPIEPAKIERDIALPAELIPRLAPLVPARSERETIAPAVQAPRLKTFVPPRIEPEAAAPPLEIPRMAPLAPPQIEREILRPADLLPRLPPVAPPAALEAAPPTAQVPRLPPVAAPTDQATEPARAAPPAATTPSTAPPATAVPPASPPAVVPGAPGGADASSDAAAQAPRGSTVTPAPVQAAPGSKPRIDLDAVRQRAREIAREDSGPRTLLPFNVRPREDTRNKEQQAFDKALKRPDCRDAYSSMGLAAVVPLLLDSVSEKGCKW